VALATPDTCASPFHADEAAQERVKTLRNYDLVKDHIKSATTSVRIRDEKVTSETADLINNEYNK